MHRQPLNCTAVHRSEIIPCALHSSSRLLRADRIRHVINGAHLIIYTKEPQADRAFFRDVLKFDSVDAGHDWLIFALPPVEAAFHPADKNGRHELYLMCDDIGSTLKELRAMNVKVSEPTEQRWGKLASLLLPGGGKLSLYEPAHPSPLKRKRRMPRLKP